MEPWSRSMLQVVSSALYGLESLWTLALWDEAAALALFAEPFGSSAPQDVEARVVLTGRGEVHRALGGLAVGGGARRVDVGARLDLSEPKRQDRDRNPLERSHQPTTAQP